VNRKTIRSIYIGLNRKFVPFFNQIEDIFLFKCNFLFIQYLLFYNFLPSFRLHDSIRVELFSFLIEKLIQVIFAGFRGTKVLAIKEVLQGLE